MARTAEPAPALGSLTQPGARYASCRECGSERVTRIAMELTDGTPVDFTSCQACEYRSWEGDGVVLSREDVLDRTRRTR
jgi:hypothetical protein